MEQARVSGLLGRVARRQRQARFGRRLHLFVLVFAGVYLAALLVARLLALIPDGFTLASTLAVPGLATLVALALARAPSRPEAARLVDRATGSKDLFLTAVLLDDAPGAYRPLVARAAEERAAGVDPRQAAPFRWRKPARDTLVALAILPLLALYLPQFDPFGREEQRREERERRRRLADSRKATDLRKRMIEKQLAAPPDRDAIQLSLRKLEQDFKRMKRRDPKGNLKRLAEQQKGLGRMWRKLSEKKLQEAFNRTPVQQRFGGGELPQMSKWREEIKRGDASGMRRELKELQDLAKQLAGMPASAEKRKLQKQLQQRMKALSDFVSTELNSRPLSTAMQRAMEQLAMSGSKALSPEALQGLQESLQLSDLEMQQFQKNLQDLKALEQALSTIQMAKQLNQLQKLDGQGCKNCQGMQDYAELYEKLLAGACKGKGPGAGMGGPGTGKGGKAPEDDTLETDYKSERSRSALTAGKVLMEWKTRGLSDPGKAREDYRRQVRQIKQGVSEAILQEQVPPGYHDAIKGYFDTLEPKAETQE